MPLEPASRPKIWSRQSLSSGLSQVRAARVGQQLFFVSQALRTVGSPP